MVDLQQQFLSYDKEAIKFLIDQLEESIIESKLKQFEDRLNQDRVIPAINILEIERELKGEEKKELSSLINKLGNVEAFSLVNLSRGGITPQEQKEMYEVLKNKLSVNEIIRLNDILGRYMEKR